MGGEQTFNIVTVEFPCSGSKELFDYRGHGALTIDKIYEPTGNKILVEVTLPQLDKDKVLTQANDEIKVTKELIRMNNPECETWTQGFKERIKKAVEHKATELKAFYA